VFRKQHILDMLDRVLPLGRPGTMRQLARRLDSPSVDQSIPAEWELAILAAAGSLFPIEIEPKLLPGQGTRPDCLLHSDGCGSMLLEIYSPNESSLITEHRMQNASETINDFAKTIGSESADRLSFEFGEWEETRHGQSYRVPSVAAHLSINAILENRLEPFLKNPDPRVISLDVPTVIEVRITKHARRIHQVNYHCPIPPILQAGVSTVKSELERKARTQLQPFSRNHICGLVVCDAGASFLSRPDSVATNPSASKQRLFAEIFEMVPIQFVMTTGVEYWSHNSFLGFGTYEDRHRYRRELYFHPDLEERLRGCVEDVMARVVENLPQPYQSGWSTRHARRAHGGKPVFRDYSSSRIAWKLGGPMRLSFSSRALLDLVSGRMSNEDFRRALNITSDPGVLKMLQRKVIVGASFAPDPKNADDGLISVELEDDIGHLTLSDYVTLRLRDSRGRTEAQGSSGEHTNKGG
jgi:hypothetical protein